MQYNFRIGNIEARSSFKSEIEIVQWANDSCWKIVGFYESKDTAKWNAYFVEDRPFDASVNWKHLRDLIQACYAFLNGEVGS